MITVPVCVDDVTTILDAKKPLEDNNVHIFPIGKYNKYIIESYSPKILIFPQKIFPLSILKPLQGPLYSKLKGCWNVFPVTPLGARDNLPFL